MPFVMGGGSVPLLGKRAGQMAGGGVPPVPAFMLDDALLASTSATTQRYGSRGARFRADQDLTIHSLRGQLRLHSGGAGWLALWDNTNTQVHLGALTWPAVDVWGVVDLPTPFDVATGEVFTVVATINSPQGYVPQTSQSETALWSSLGLGALPGVTWLDTVYNSTPDTGTYPPLVLTNVYYGLLDAAITL